MQGSWVVLVLAAGLDAGRAFRLGAAPPLPASHHHRSRAPRAAGTADVADEVDVVVIGSGLGGLSTAGLMASQGYKVAVFEAHYELGGCCHEYNVGLDGRTIPSAALAKKPETPVFRFEAGPSLYSGLSPAASPNPLKHVYQMVGEEPEWIQYDTWGAHLPEVPDGYELSIGAENFKEILRRYGGPTASADWELLAEKLRPLSKGVMALPSTAVRGDAGVLVTLGAKASRAPRAADLSPRRARAARLLTSPLRRTSVAQYPAAFANVLLNAKAITAPFDLAALGVKDAFLRNYLDLIAFLLQVTRPGPAP